MANPDFTNTSNFDERAGFKKIVFANNVPALASEDVELQDIQNNLREKGLTVFGNGCFNGLKISVFDSKMLFDAKSYLLVNGDIYIIPKDLAFDLGEIEDSSIVFVEFYQKLVDGDSVLKEYGCENAEVIDNKIIDPEFGYETSKRIQLCSRIRIAQSDTISGLKAFGNNDEEQDAVYVVGSDMITYSAYGETLNTIDDVVYALPICSVDSEYNFEILMPEVSGGGGSIKPEDIIPIVAGAGINFVEKDKIDTPILFDDIIPTDIVFDAGSWTGDMENGFTHVVDNTSSLSFYVDIKKDKFYRLEFSCSSSGGPLDIVFNNDDGDNYQLIKTVESTSFTNIPFFVLAEDNYNRIEIFPDVTSTKKFTFIKFCEAIQNTKTIGLNKFDVVSRDNSLYIGGGGKFSSIDEEDLNISLGYKALHDNVSGNYNTVMGYQALYDNITGQQNTAIGYSVLNKNTVGNYNTAIGYQATYKNVTGDYNVAIGYNALYNNTTGIQNTAIGSNALNKNTTGHYNTAIGYGALLNNTMATSNTAIGYFALQANTTGIQNTAIGYFALNKNTTGGYNTAIGYCALLNNTTGIQNTAIGYFALRDNITGAQNTAIGYQALNSNTGQYNTAVGYNALLKNTSGNNNTAIGRIALSKNTSGNNNTAIGVQALYNNTTGGQNTAVGYDALNKNTTGDYNTAIGQDVLYVNTTGYQNTAVGYSALYNNTTGQQNTAIGYQASRGNTTGGYNVAIGYNALYNNTTGIQNTAIGYRALYGNTGQYNTAVGYNASRGNTTGEYNVAIGCGALDSNKTGQYNTAIGYQALSINTIDEIGGISDNTAIGYQALYDNGNAAEANTAIGSGALRGKNQGGNVAIGYQALFTGAPYTGAYGPRKTVAIGYQALYSSIGNAGSSFNSNTAIGYQALYSSKEGYFCTAVGCSALYSFGSGSMNTAIGCEALYNATMGANTAIGYQALYDNTTGSLNAAVGDRSLAANTTGVSNTAVGQYAMRTTKTASRNIAIGWQAYKVSTDYDNSIVIGVDISPSASNQIIFGNSSTTQFRCQVTSITSLSDRRIKDDIEPANLDMCLDAVMSLPVSRYKYKDFTGTHLDKHVTGWLADDVEKVFPKAVQKTDELFPVLDGNGNEIYEKEDEEFVGVDENDDEIITKEQELQKLMFMMKDVKTITMTEALPTLWGAVQKLAEKVDKLERLFETRS